MRQCEDMKFLTAKDVLQAKKYKYRGSDNSLLYRYVLTPMNNFLMDHVIPMWIAPNLITMIGFAANVVAFLLLAAYSPYLDSELPRWVSAFFGFSIFFYQTLDNLDGKQARRTGSSSPLGLLFDHGCDVISLILTSLSLSTLLGTGVSNNVTLAFWTVGTVAFMFATWEHYHTGELNLGIINGPTDGGFLTFIFGILDALYGPRFWRIPLTVSFPKLSVFLPEFAQSFPAYSIPLAIGLGGILPTISSQ